MATGRFVSYLRVSTQRQGASGLGLEAQRSAVDSYLNGGSWQLIAEVVEIESGKNSARPKLAEALRLCRLHGATLVVAKLDRLARNVAFTSALMESGIDFVAVDFPDANRLTIHILAAVAEHEAKAISARTKEALAAVKDRSKIGGLRENSHVINTADRSKSASVRRAKADERIADLAPVIDELRAAGIRSVKSIAAALNERNIPAARGAWHATSVSRLLGRLGVMRLTGKLPATAKGR